MMRHARYAILALLLLAAAGIAQARVFWLLGGRDRGGLLDPGELNWQRAYAASLRVNEGRADVAVWSTSHGMEQAFADLRQRIEGQGGRAFFAAGGALGWGLAASPDRVWRFVATATEGGTCHLVQLTQSPEDYRASRRPPSAHILRAVPEVPGSRPSLYLANEDTGLALASARTRADAGETLRLYAGTLAADGWTPLLPASAQSGLYARGRDILAVHAVSSGEGADCLITLVHKQRGAGDEP